MGEQGPELITLGRTSRVYNARDTAAMGSHVAYSPQYHIEITATDAADIEARLRRVLDEHDSELLKLLEMGVSPTAQGV